MNSRDKTVNDRNCVPGSVARVPACAAPDRVRGRRVETAALEREGPQRFVSLQRCGPRVSISNLNRITLCDKAG